MNLSVFVDSFKYINDNFIIIVSLGSWIYQELSIVKYTQDKLIDSIIAKDDIEIFDSIVHLNKDPYILIKFLRFINHLIYPRLRDRINKIVESLIQNGADIHLEYNLLLEYAMKYNHVKIIKLMLESNIDICSNEKILSYASIRGFTEIVKELLLAGADVNDEALTCACGTNDIELIKLLINAGAKFNKDSLRSAVINGYPELVKMILETNTIDIHFDNDQIIKDASLFGCTEMIIKELLLAGADIHANNDQPLRNACYYGDIELVKILLEHGADIYTNNDEPLRTAIYHRHKEIAKILLDHYTK